jgi:ABC-2 type transport system permease protein
MIYNLKLYLELLRISIASQFQYKASLWMQSFGRLLMTGIEFLSIWALFNRFHNLLGWTLPEVGLFYGFVCIIFSVADAGSKGFDMLPSLIRTGEFDRILLRPLSPLIQLAGREFNLRRFGRFLQGIAIFIWASRSLSIAWTIPKIFLLLWTSFCGVSLFVGIFILQATLCFWTVESVEVGNILTYGGVETSQVPLSVYPANFQRFFTYIVPLGCISYYPLLTIIGKADPMGSSIWFQTLSPLFGFIFLLISWQCWGKGIQHYSSAGG